MSRKMVVIVGYPGAGKTTLGRMLAVRNDFAFLSEDIFVREMNPASIETRAVEKNDWTYGLNNLKFVLSIYLGTKRSVVVEGNFIEGPFHLEDWRKMATKSGFEFIPILLVGNEQKRRRRRLRMGQKLTKTHDIYVRREMRKLGYLEECRQFDTTKQSLLRSFETLDKMVNDWPYQDI